MDSLLSFQDVISQTNNPNLLLGNGFSMAFDKDRFSFTSLLKSAVEKGIISVESEVYKLFDVLQTSDFESVMKILDDSQKVIQTYDPQYALLDNIRSDTDNLKKYLVEIITNNHPDKCTDIPDEQKAACVQFLNHFGSIYTLNYDLLLYWTIMSNDNLTQKLGDGFGEDEDSIDEGYVVYQNGHGYKMFYLHGGLHLFDNGYQVIKETYSKTDISLMDQTRKNLDEGKYPIFISEGDSKQKLKKIMHSGYMSSCYRSLKNKGGDLMIFGTMLKTNDEHILDAILSSKIKNIYMGVSRRSAVDHVKTRIDVHNDKYPRRKKNLYLYDYKTVNPWKYTSQNN